MKPTLTRKVRTWYGLSLTLRFFGTYWAAIGPLPPHPQLVNMVLRIGLSTDDSLHLQTIHETGHLQTFPALVLAGFLLFLVSDSLWFTLVAFLVLSEIMAEAYVIWREGRNYFRIYGLGSG